MKRGASSPVLVALTLTLTLLLRSLASSSLLPGGVMAFSPPTNSQSSLSGSSLLGKIMFRTTPVSTTTITTLYAKKQQKKSQKKKNASSGGSGFASSGGGSSSSGSGGSSGTTTDNSFLQGKVRAISSTTGSGAGSKPLRQAALLFDELRKEYGPSCTNDVYCRSPKNNPSLFWYVGKIATQPNTVATPQQAILSQKRIILEYAKRELRPQNFASSVEVSAALELWLAPGDSELDVVQNKIDLEKVIGSATSEYLHDDFRVTTMVGFNPEIYVGDERIEGGLRVERDEYGKPTKPIFEVNQSL